MIRSLFPLPEIFPQDLKKNTQKKRGNPDYKSDGMHLGISQDDINDPPQKDKLDQDLMAAEPLLIEDGLFQDTPEPVKIKDGQSPAQNQSPKNGSVLEPYAGQKDKA
jgi:hypothetical protein